MYLNCILLKQIINALSSVFESHITVYISLHTSYCIQYGWLLCILLSLFILIFACSRFVISFYYICSLFSWNWNKFWSNRPTNCNHLQPLTPTAHYYVIWFIQRDWSAGRQWKWVTSPIWWCNKLCTRLCLECKIPPIKWSNWAWQHDRCVCVCGYAAEDEVANVINYCGKGWYCGRHCGCGWYSYVMVPSVTCL